MDSDHRDKRAQGPGTDRIVDGRGQSEAGHRLDLFFRAGTGSFCETQERFRFWEDFDRCHGRRRGSLVIEGSELSAWCQEVGMVHSWSRALNTW